MAIASAQIKATGGVPEVEVIFGQAQIGTYRCFRWDANAQNPQQIGFGNNIDSLSDQFPVGQPAAALNGFYVSWEAIIQTASSAPGQLYSFIVLIRQDGAVVPGGLIQETGQFETLTKSLIGFARFVTT